MSSVFQFVDWVGMESLRNLVNRLEIADAFNTDYNKEFTKEFAVGETVRVKNPQRFLIREGLSYSPQPINRTYTTITCDQVFGVDFEFDSVEQALKMERGEEWFKKEYLEPAMLQISQEIDSRAANFATLNTNNIVGSLVTTPTDTSIAGSARQRLIENACPPGLNKMVIDPGTMTSVVNGTTTLFNPPDEITKQWKTGAVGEARNFDWYESMSLYQTTGGNWQTPSAVTFSSTSLAQGNTIIVNCTTGDTFLAGDVFNIAAVNNVNPKTRRSTGVLKQFVVLANATGASSLATLIISPAITGPGDQYQNVDALPVSTALLTLYPGTTSPSGKTGWNGLVLNRDAFALVGVKLALPKAVEMSVQKRDPKSGIAVRFVRMFDPVQSRMINRFDVLLGFGALYPDNCAVRILSAT